MPELPEVETVVRGLNQQILGRKILNVSLSEKKLRLPYPEGFVQNISNCTIRSISRKSKYILIKLDAPQTMVIHLGMSGKLIAGQKLVAQKHDHVRFELSGEKEMVFNDPRRFGLVTLIEDENIESHRLFKSLGIEPLSDTFDGQFLMEALAKRKSCIKAAIMDAELVVGVGNIYACESLFVAGILPDRQANSLKPKEAEKLVQAIKVVLQEAIKAGGSTLKDYVGSNGDKGYFQHKFQVYGRTNQGCYNCNNIIQNQRIAGRSSFYCISCQN